MFEGFSDAARAVVDASHAQARALGHHATGTAHRLASPRCDVGRRGDDAAARCRLLGLLAHQHQPADPDGEGVGDAGPLAVAGVSLEGLRAEYQRRGVDLELNKTLANDGVLSGGWGGPGLPWTGEARKAFEFALRRALQLGRATTTGSGRRQLITPSHVLLGVLDRPQSTGRQLVVQLGVDLERLTHEAERVAAAAPLVTMPTAQDAWVETDVARAPTPDHDGAIFSIFGWPSQLRLDGPEARRVLAEAKDSGDFNSERLLAAAEADAANRSPQDGSDGDQ